MGTAHVCVCTAVSMVGPLQVWSHHGHEQAGRRCGCGRGWCSSGPVFATLFLWDTHILSVGFPAVWYAHIPLAYVLYARVCVEFWLRLHRAWTCIAVVKQTYEQEGVVNLSWIHCFCPDCASRWALTQFYKGKRSIAFQTERRLPHLSKVYDHSYSKACTMRTMSLDAHMHAGACNVWQISGVGKVKWTYIVYITNTHLCQYCSDVLIQPWEAFWIYMPLECDPVFSLIVMVGFFSGGNTTQM